MASYQLVVRSRKLNNPYIWFRLKFTKFTFPVFLTIFGQNLLEMSNKLAHFIPMANNVGNDEMT